MNNFFESEKSNNLTAHQEIATYNRHLDRTADDAKIEAARKAQLAMFEQAIKENPEATSLQIDAIVRAMLGE